MRNSGTLVWLLYERVYGKIVNLGAFYSEVEYTWKGIDYQVLIENDEFEIVGDHSD